MNELIALFKAENLPQEEGQDCESLRKIKEAYGGARGLMTDLSTDEKTGIIGDERDIKRRQNIFG